ncbi:MAG: DNA gyrase modulator, partial [Myxococcota bacterium]|nr:DNA gyrase modulator [Myxococcota bacterium]
MIDKFGDFDTRGCSMKLADRRALCEIALEAATAAGARYVEARVVRRTRESLVLKDGSLDLSSSNRDVGIGIRALMDNGWGYGATNLLRPESIQEAARAATDAAQATARDASQEIHIPDAVSGEYTTPMTEDPFQVSLDEKVNLIAGAQRRILEQEGVAAARGGYVGHRQQSTFVASNGSEQEQAVTLCGGGLSAIAEGNGDVQIRSAPKSMEGNVLQGGFEKLRGMNLEQEGERIAREAVALLSADPTPEGTTTILLDGAQLSLQIHESVGHPTELDRVLGEEI